VQHLWHYTRYGRIAGPSGGDYRVRFERMATTGREQRCRIAVLSDLFEPMFWMEGTVEADSPDDPVVAQLEDSLAAEALRRLQFAEWKRGETYELQR
jgi:hypothetical protein